MRARTSAALVRHAPEQEREETVADDLVERLELEFGDCAFAALDSDDIEELIASGAVWMPSVAGKKQ